MLGSGQGPSLEFKGPSGPANEGIGVLSRLKILCGMWDEVCLNFYVYASIVVFFFLVLTFFI